jgi:hypothetical protein
MLLLNHFFLIMRGYITAADDKGYARTSKESVTLQK